MPELPGKKLDYPTGEATCKCPESTWGGAQWSLAFKPPCQATRNMSKAILDPPVQSSCLLNTLRDPFMDCMSASPQIHMLKPTAPIELGFLGFF